MIRNSINKLIRRVNPKWVTTGERLRLLKQYYTDVVIESTKNIKGMDAGYSIICKVGDMPADVHLGVSRKQAIDRAYQELHKVIFFTQLHL